MEVLSGLKKLHSLHYKESSKLTPGNYPLCLKHLRIDERHQPIRHLFLNENFHQ